MNATQTYTAFYSTYIPASLGRGGRDIFELPLISGATVRAAADAALPLETRMPLLCSDSSVSTTETDLDKGVFPVMQPQSAVYRPRDKCNWDLIARDASGLRAMTNVFWLAVSSRVTFSASRQRPLDELTDAQKLVLGNGAEAASMSLQARSCAWPSTWRNASDSAAIGG